MHIELLAIGVDGQGVGEADAFGVVCPCEAVGDGARAGGEDLEPYLADLPVRGEVDNLPVDHADAVGDGLAIGTAFEQQRTVRCGA